MALLNRVRCLTATTGTGDVTVGAAYSAAYMTPSDAGAVNGEVYTWLICEGNDFEIVRGAWASGTNSFARTTVLKSKIGGVVGTSKMNLAGAATIAIIAAAEDVAPYDVDYLVKTASSVLSNERAATDVASAGGVVWDWATAGQAKAKLFASAADKLLYSTGANTFAETALTSAARGLLDDTTVADMRTTLQAATAQILDGSENLNSIVESGLYRLQTAHANLPPGCGWGQMLVSRGSDTIMQIACDFAGVNLYWRSGNPSDVGGVGSWSAWRKIYHDGNAANLAALDGLTPVNWTVIGFNGSGALYTQAIGGTAWGLVQYNGSTQYPANDGSLITNVLKPAASANLSAGYTATSYAAGTKSSGTFTPDPTLGNIQHVTNGGAHTLAPPASCCTMLIEYLNNASAGALTTSGYTKVTGDAYNTTNGNKFAMFVTKTNSYSHLYIQALQ